MMYFVGVFFAVFIEIDVLQHSQWKNIVVLGINDCLAYNKYLFVLFKSSLLALLTKDPTIVSEKSLQLFILMFYNVGLPFFFLPLA